MEKNQTISNFYFLLSIPYLLINQLIWNFIFDTILILWQPVPIFNAENANDLSYRFILAYSNGVFRYTGRYFLYIEFTLLFIAIIGMTHSLYFNMVYRLSAIFYDSWFGMTLQDSTKMWRLFGGTLGAAIVVFGWPFFSLVFAPKDLELLYNDTIKAMPAMKEIFRLEPSLSGCDVPSCGIISIYFIGGQEGIAVLCISISIFPIGYLYHRRAKYIQVHTNMSHSTIKLNRMLMIALMVHMGIILSLLLFPAMVLYGIMLFGNEKQNIFLEIITVLFTCHSTLDIPAMIFFIKPYRLFVLDRFFLALRTIGLENLEKWLKKDQTIVVAQSSSGINTSVVNRANIINNNNVDPFRI